MTFPSPPLASHLLQPVPMTCFQSVEKVSLLRDGEITPQEHEDLRHHIAHCPSCQVANRQFQTLFSGLDQLLASQTNQTQA